MHVFDLLGIKIESTDFQPNSTGFKLVSGTDIKFEQIKTTQYDLICDILEVSGKDHNVLFVFA